MDPTTTADQGPAMMPTRLVIKRLWRDLRPFAWYLAGGFAMLLLVGACTLVTPLIWREVTDQVLTRFISGQLAKDEALHRLVQFILLIALLYLVQPFLSGIRGWMLGKAAQQFVLDLRMKVYAKLQSQSLSFYHDARTGDLTARVTGDIERIHEVLANGADQFLFTIMMLVGAAAIVIWMQPWLGIGLVLPSLAILVSIALYSRWIEPIYKKSRDQVGNITALLTDHILGIQVIQAFAREPEENVRFRKACTELYHINMRGVLARTFFFPAQGIISHVGWLVMLGGGGWLVIRGQFTIGGLIALQGYWWWLYGPMDMLWWLNDMLQGAFASCRRIYEVLDAETEIIDRPTARPLPPLTGGVRFAAVRFAYRRGGEVLRGLDLTVAPGEKLAVVGSSGAGKSTMLMMIPRFFDVTAGQLLLDGHDVRDVRLADLRRRIGIVLQETHLFNTSVEENIRYGQPDADAAAVARAAAMANAHEFIQEMPQGYQTLVGERGVKLSGGQRQRIAIARAFLAAPHILILDEATNSVEPESERIIQEALVRLMAGRTTFITSHRYSLLRVADRICVLEEGVAAELGTHDELMTRNGTYAHMYRMQMHSTKQTEKMVL